MIPTSLLIVATTVFGTLTLRTVVSKQRQVIVESIENILEKCQHIDATMASANILAAENNLHVDFVPNVKCCEEMEKVREMKTSSTSRVGRKLFTILLSALLGLWERFEIDRFLRFQIRFGRAIDCRLITAKLQWCARFCRVQAWHKVFAVFSAGVHRVLVSWCRCLGESPILRDADHIHRLLQSAGMNIGLHFVRQNSSVFWSDAPPLSHGWGSLHTPVNACIRWGDASPQNLAVSTNLRPTLKWLHCCFRFIHQQNWYILYCFPNISPLIIPPQPNTEVNAKLATKDINHLDSSYSISDEVNQTPSCTDTIPLLCSVTGTNGIGNNSSTSTVAIQSPTAVCVEDIIYKTSMSQWDASMENINLDCISTISN